MFWKFNAEVKYFVPDLSYHNQVVNRGAFENLMQLIN